MGAGHGPGLEERPRSRLRAQVAAVHAVPQDPRHEGKVDGPYRLGWLPDYPSPENYLDPLYGEGSSNYGKWGRHRRPATSSSTWSPRATPPPSVEEGIPTYQEAADVVLDDMPVIPLWFGKTFIVYSDNVENVQYSPLDQILLGEVEVTS